MHKSRRMRSSVQSPLPDAPELLRSCNSRANQIEEKMKRFSSRNPDPRPFSLPCLAFTGEKNTAVGFGLLSFPPSDDLIIAGFVELPWATLASLDEWQLAVCSDDPAFDRNMPFSPLQETLKIPPSAAGGDTPNVHHVTSTLSQVVKLFRLNCADLSSRVRKCA